MSFDFNLFDINKEMESLNNRLKNKREIVKETPLQDIKKKENNLNVQSKSELNADNLLTLKHIEKENFGTEFIIIEKDEKDDNTNLISESEQLKRKREEKKMIRLERKKMLKKERDDFFNKANAKSNANADADADSNIVINDSSDKLILQNLKIVSKNKEEVNNKIQSRVKQIVNIEEKYNNEILNLQTNYSSILENKDNEIIRLKQEIHNQNIQNSEIDKKVNKELEKIRSEKKKEFSKLEEKRKIIDKRIKEQQLKLKKETEKLKKQQEEIISLKKIKDKELTRIIAQTNISENLNEEKEEDLEKEGVVSFEEILLRKKLANIKNKNSIEYRKAVESYRIIISRNRQTKRKNKKKENSNKLVPNVSNALNLPNIANNIKIKSR